MALWKSQIYFLWLSGQDLLPIGCGVVLLMPRHCSTLLWRFDSSQVRFGSFHLISLLLWSLCFCGSCCFFFFFFFFFFFNRQHTTNNNDNNDNTSLNIQGKTPIVSLKPTQALRCSAGQRAIASGCCERQTQATKKKHHRCFTHENPIDCWFNVHIPSGFIKHGNGKIPYQ